MCRVANNELRIKNACGFDLEVRAPPSPPSRPVVIPSHPLAIPPSSSPPWLFLSTLFPSFPLARPPAVSLPSPRSLPCPLPLSRIPSFRRPRLLSPPRACSQVGIVRGEAEWAEAKEWARRTMVSDPSTIFPIPNPNTLEVQTVKPAP
eukprot:3939136-Rhodomonas_salina.1